MVQRPEAVRRVASFGDLLVFSECLTVPESRLGGEEWGQIERGHGRFDLGVEL